MKTLELALVAATIAAQGAFAARTYEIGTGDSPLAALGQIRADRKAGRLGADETADVVFAPGIHRLTDRCILEKGDSNVVFRAAKPGTVRLTAGVDLPAERFRPVTDGAILARLPEEVRGRVRVADLSAEFPKGLPPWENRVAMPPAPFLYRPDGTPAQIARWPNAGEYRIFRKAIHNGTAPDPKNPARRIPVAGGSFAFDGDRIDRWRLGEGVWLFGYFKFDWSSDIVRIASCAGTNRVVALADRTSYGVGRDVPENHRYYAMNLLDEIDAPDEWWFDRRNAKLYLLPGDAKGTYHLATEFTTAFQTRGTANVRFENLDFDYAHRFGGGALLELSGENIRVERCTFRCLAQTAVSANGRDNVIAHCVFEHFGGSVVTLQGGDRATLANGRNALLDSRISDFSVLKRTFAPAITVKGCGNAVRRTLVETSPYIGMCYEGNEHLFEGNEFRDVVQETNDSGAVYEGYDPSSLGIILFGNHVHDLGGDRRHWGQRNGFYFDDCDWGAYVVGNTFERMGYATEIGGGNLHVFRNNVIRDCLRAYRMDWRGFVWQENYHRAFRADTNGVSFAEQAGRRWNFRRPPWSVAYPEYAKAMDDCPELPIHNVFKDNVVGGCPLPAPDPATWRQPETWSGNVVYTNLTDAPARPTLPVRFEDAAETVVSRTTTNGTLRATFALDVAGRLTWSAARNGRTILARSPLGITVDGRDWGRYVVPAPATDAKEGSATVPLRDLLTGEVGAYLDARITDDGGVSYRWRIPGPKDLGHTVQGEMDAFELAPGTQITEAERPESWKWPAATYVNRKGVTGLVYGNYTAGFRVSGPVCSPWRGVKSTAPLADAAARVEAYSVLTRDGRRLVSRTEGTNVVFSFVATNALPADLPPVREWKLCVVKATHTDIGLHNSQYVQRKGSVDFTKAASRLIAADPQDGDPAAYRYVCEGTWFLHNTLLDRGEEALRRLVTNDFARGRMGVGCTCAGNHTHVYGAEELCRSAYSRRWLVDDCGIASRTMIMTDNPGISWSVVEPYAQAGVENVLFSPNQWNPRPSAIWPMRKGPGDQWNAECGGGGSRIDLRWAGDLPMLFWWESPDGLSRLLVCSGGTYSWSCENFGFRGWNFDFRKDRGETMRLLAGQLRRMERKSPVDLWIIACYGDDECPGTGYSDFARKWNSEYAWPRFETVGNLDRPFDHLRKNFGGKIPVCRGEMSSGWLQHIVCAPSLLAQKLAVDRLLPTAEALATIAAVRESGAPGDRALPRGVFDPSRFNAAYWYLVLNDEHSYGTSGYSGRRVFETWMQHRDWIDRAGEIATAALARAAGALKLPRAAEPARILANGRTVENDWYRVRVSPAGEILSLFDKDLRRELLKGTANKFLYTRDNHKSWADPKLLGAEIVQRVYLVRDEKRIDVENRFSHARDLFNSNRYNRFGYLAFPFDVPQPKFVAQLNGPVIDPCRDQTGHCTDAYVGVRDWCAVEGADFGVALFQRDSFLVEFGEIHPDKTCCSFGRSPAASGLYSYLFTDWLQMHQPDGDSFNFDFRYSITSYRGTWRDNHLPAKAQRLLAPEAEAVARYVSADAPNVRLLALKAAETGDALIARFRETEGRRTRVRARQSLVSGATYELCDVTEHVRSKLDGFAFDLRPFGTATVRISARGLRLPAARPDPRVAENDLIVRPRAGHGEKKGQMYLLWGADRSEGFDRYELYRSARPNFVRDRTTFVASVTNEPGFATARYEDLGLSHHTRYWYDVRPVFKDGRKGAFLGEFSGLTRGDTDYDGEK